MKFYMPILAIVTIVHTTQTTGSERYIGGLRVDVEGVRALNDRALLADLYKIVSSCEHKLKNKIDLLDGFEHYAHAKSVKEEVIRERNKLIEERTESELISDKTYLIGLQDAPAYDIAEFALIERQVEAARRSTTPHPSTLSRGTTLPTSSPDEITTIETSPTRFTPSPSRSFFKLPTQKPTITE